MELQQILHSTMSHWFTSSGRQASPTLPATSENANMFVDLLREAPLFGHRQPASTLGGILYCILLVGYAIVLGLASWIFSSLAALLPALSSSANVVLLIFTGFLQHYLLYQVKKEQMKGFYIFSQKLKPMVHLPFAVVSYGTAIILLIMAWHPFLHVAGLSVFTLLRIVIFLEILWAGASVSLYIWCMHRHNSMDIQPDVANSLYSALQPFDSIEGLRSGDTGRLVEQQTALLQYQRENLHYLSEEILRLQECLSKYERSENGNTPQVDVVHLLAAREQELRALSAERDQLHSELHLARRLIEERDAEIQQIRMINDQYVTENGRLRDIIREWSTRAAKVERALEDEKLSNVELQKKITTQRHSNEEST